MAKAVVHLHDKQWILLVLAVSMIVLAMVIAGSGQTVALRPTQDFIDPSAGHVLILKADIMHRRTPWLVIDAHGRQLEE